MIEEAKQQVRDDEQHPELSSPSNKILHLMKLANDYRNSANTQMGEKTLERALVIARKEPDAAVRVPQCILRYAICDQEGQGASDYTRQWQQKALEMFDKLPVTNVDQIIAHIEVAMFAAGYTAFGEAGFCETFYRTNLQYFHEEPRPISADEGRTAKS